MDNQLSLRERKLSNVAESLISPSVGVHACPVTNTFQDFLLYSTLHNITACAVTYTKTLSSITPIHEWLQVKNALI